MTSSVFYRFKSQKEPTRLEFDGTGISVFELKRDIIIKSGLGDGTDFDLAVFSDDGKEEYDDDTAIIPRSTTVLARRLPAIKKGAGKANRYVTGKMPVNAKNSSRKEQASKAKPSASANGPTQMNSSMTEEQRMAAMFQAQSEQWSAQQEEAAKQTKVHYAGKKPGANSDNPPPLGYVCYRCGEKGHWIKECPTNDDPNFENKPRIKRTTGIPRSFLKTVEKPALTGDGTDDAKPPSGIMVNAEGQFVIAEPDKASWDKFQEKTKSSAAAQKAAALGDKELQDRGLECSIDKRVFIDPMKTPCCEKTYCNDCITNALIESDFTCPGCQTEGVLIDDLKPDDETSAKIKAYLDEKNAAAKKEREKERSRSPSVKPESPPAVPEKAKSKSPIPKSPIDSNSPAKPVTSPPGSTSTPTTEKSPVKDQPATKKRPADELLENPKIPKGPKAMQQQEAQKQAMQQQQQMMNGMAGFPNMPFNMNMPNNFFNNNGFPPMPNNILNSFPMMPNSMPIMPMNPMMGMNGMNFNAFPNMYNPGVGGFGGMGNMGMMNGGGMVNGNGNLNGGGGAQNGHGIPIGPAGSFPNQQKTVFAEPLPNEEDNAYFRKPVNPNRHQGRQRRARPQDYREL